MATPIDRTSSGLDFSDTESDLSESTSSYNGRTVSDLSHSDSDDDMQGELTPLGGVHGRLSGGEGIQPEMIDTKNKINGGEKIFGAIAGTLLVGVGGVLLVGALGFPFTAPVAVVAIAAFAIFAGYGVHQVTEGEMKQQFGTFINLSETYSDPATEFNTFARRGLVDRSMLQQEIGAGKIRVKDEAAHDELQAMLRRHVQGTDVKAEWNRFRNAHSFDSIFEIVPPTRNAHSASGA